MWMGRFSGEVRKSGTIASTQAAKPFMSHAPRPYRRPSASRMTNGGLVHACPSTGTTSACPERTTPPSTRGPTVARSALLSPDPFGARREATPCAERYSSTKAISGRFDRLLTLSNAIRRASSALALPRRSSLIASFPVRSRRARSEERRTRQWTRRRASLECLSHVHGCHASGQSHGRADLRAGPFRSGGKPLFLALRHRDRQSRRQGCDADRAAVAHNGRGGPPAGGARSGRGRRAADN